MTPLRWTYVESSAASQFVVAPDQRLSWPRTIDIGAQLGSIAALALYHGMTLLGVMRRVR